jgi:hypothetical protein
MSTLRKDQMEEDPLIDSGQRYYDEHLRDLLEPGNTGRYVAIEPVSGRYFVDDLGTNTLLKAQEVLPDAQFYLARVGFPVADTLTGYGRRVR